jgi:glycosyltransferase involved in cell wall biosynthesis
VDILCFGSADFEERNWVNAQHLMWRLARKHRILYVNSLGLRMPRPCQRDLRKVLRRVSGIRTRLWQPAAGRRLHVLSPATLPLARWPWWRSLGSRLLVANLRHAMRQLDFVQPVIWTFLPSAQDAIRRLQQQHLAGPLVYHCVDAYEANPGADPVLVRELEDAILRSADRVIAASHPLYRRLSPRHPRTHLMANVADTDLYPPPGQPPPEPEDLAPIPHPRIGYLGNLASYKCDIPLLERAIRKRPDLAWILIGGIGLGEAATPVRKLAALPSVHLLGEKPGDQLPGYLHHIDVGLIPFAINATTRYSFPMKFFEYLACGIPVVTARLESLSDHIQPPLVFPYDESGGFLEAIQAALDADHEGLATRRRALAEANSWKRRIAEIETLLQELRPGSAPAAPYSEVTSS